MKKKLLTISLVLLTYAFSAAQATLPTDLLKNYKGYLSIANVKNNNATDPIVDCTVTLRQSGSEVLIDFEGFKIDSGRVELNKFTIPNMKATMQTDYYKLEPQAQDFLTRINPTTTTGQHKNWFLTFSNQLSKVAYAPGDNPAQIVLRFTIDDGNGFEIKVEFIGYQEVIYSLPADLVGTYSGISDIITATNFGGARNSLNTKWRNATTEGEVSIELSNLKINSGTIAIKPFTIGGFGLNKETSNPSRYVLTQAQAVSVAVETESGASDMFQVQLAPDLPSFIEYGAGDNPAQVALYLLITSNTHGIMRLQYTALMQANTEENNNNDTPAAMTDEKIVFNLTANTTNVRFTFNLTDLSDSLYCDFGAGEAKRYFKPNADGSLAQVEYTFANRIATDRKISVAADKLKTIRVVFSSAITGIDTVKSNVLENFNMDFTLLWATPHVDFSQCPALKQLTLSSSDVREVTLPQSAVFETLQVSPGSAGLVNLEKIHNLEYCTNLKDLNISGAKIDTLDLTSNTNIQTLTLSAPKTKMKAILGAKDLRKIERLDVRANALGFDQIPDLHSEDIPLEQFQYSGQGSYTLNKSKINELTVDLSHLYKAKGLSSTEQTTVFEWYYKQNSSASYVSVPANKMIENDAVFTFDRTLSDDDTIRVYFRATNAGYPGIGTSNKNYISSYMIKLIKPAATNVDMVENSSIFVSIVADGAVRVENPANEEFYIYSSTGSLIASGNKSQDIRLPQGVYILRTKEGRSLKFVR